MRHEHASLMCARPRMVQMKRARIATKGCSFSTCAREVSRRGFEMATSSDQIRWRTTEDGRTVHAFVGGVRAPSLCGRVEHSIKLPDRRSTSCRRCLRLVAAALLGDLDVSLERLQEQVTWKPSTTGVSHGYCGTDARSVCHQVRRRPGDVPLGHDSYCSKCWAIVYPGRDPVDLVRATRPRRQSRRRAPATPKTRVRRRRGTPAPRCVLVGCDLPGRSKGLCKGHYIRKVRHGDPTARTCTRCEKLRTAADCSRSFEIGGRGRVKYVCSPCLRELNPTKEPTHDPR